MLATEYEQFEDAEKALAELARIPLSCLSAEELGVCAIRAQELRARVDAFVCSVTAAAEAAGTHTLGPSRTIAS